MRMRTLSVNTHGNSSALMGSRQQVPKVMTLLKGSVGWRKLAKQFIEINLLILSTINIVIGASSIVFVPQSLAGYITVDLS